MSLLIIEQNIYKIIHERRVKGMEVMAFVQAPNKIKEIYGNIGK